MTLGLKVRRRQRCGTFLSTGGNSVSGGRVVVLVLKRPSEVSRAQGQHQRILINSVLWCDFGHYAWKLKLKPGSSSPGECMHYPLSVK